MIARFGRLLFSLAIVGIGVETLICATTPKVVPVIPWLPAIPALACVAGIVFVVSGIGLLVPRTAFLSAIALGLVMVFSGLAFDAPRHPDLMSAPWRTNVLEPIVIACLAWLACDGIPGWLQKTSRYLLVFSLVVFGAAHFQVPKMMATMVPGWIPWPWFWTIFFGVAFIVAAMSFATGILQRWAAFGVGLMVALWTLTIHLPLLVAKPVPDHWSDVFIVVAWWGGFWALTRKLNDE